MAFNLNVFRSNISQYGVLPASKFQVFIATPPCLVGSQIDNNSVTSGFSEMPKLLSMRACDAQVPGAQLATGMFFRYGVGPVEKKAHNVTFQDIPISFVCDKEGAIWNFFYLWLNRQFNWSPSSVGNQNDQNLVSSYPSYSLGYKNGDKGYSSFVAIQIFDTHGNVKKQFELIEAYPVGMSDTPLSWEQSNSLIKLTVQMHFREYAMVNVSSVINGADASQYQPIPGYSQLGLQPTPKQFGQ